MDTNKLLQVASEIIAKVPACMAITVDSNGNADARVVNTKALTSDWTVRFVTDLRTRKAQEIQRSGRLTLAYQYEAGHSYVSLVGRAAITNDVAGKTASWRPESYRWHPGGPADPNVVYIDFTAERIELWSTSDEVVPDDPTRGLWAAVLVREDAGWRQTTSLPPQA